MMLRLPVAVAYSFVVLAALFVSVPAHAIDLQCIEASKYKYLYRIFNDDREKVAAFLQVTADRLPDGEMCRAILITGHIISSQEAEKSRQMPDPDKLLQAVSQNGGWLATAYLASSGGSIATGRILGEMVRLFWLKTVSRNAKTFQYQPDFLAVGEQPSALPQAELPPDLAQGWAQYLAAIEANAQVSVSEGTGRCASSCTFSHVAGIDRNGPVFVHRGRVARHEPKNADLSLAETLERLQRIERQILAYYRSMDAGAKFIQLYQRTPTATVAKAVAERFPRYLYDVFRARCGADLQQLENLESKIRSALDKASQSSNTAEIEHQRNELATLRAGRQKFEQCVVASNEKERLAQFAKFCANGCDSKQVMSVVDAKLRELLPAASARRKAKS